MGIPYYFYNLTQKYKDIITKKIPENPEIYAIDFNGIIHPIAAKIIKEKGNEDKIIEELWKKIDEIKINKIYVCVDGIAPVAKIIQQRKRRYLTIYKNKIDDIKSSWDTNAISPGTNFMNKLNNYIKTKIRYNTSDINIIYSGSDENGEGEHKIFDKLRQEENGKVIIINGLDADLIILSMLSGKSNIYLMREKPDELTNYLCIDNLKKAIIKELKNKWTITNEYNDIEIIESYCVMCSILGNDFIPHQLTLNLKDNGLDKLINITGISIKNNGLLVSNNKINYECLAEIFERIASTEDIDIQKEVQKYIAKRPNSTINSEEYAIKNKDKLAYNIYSSEISKWRNLYYKSIFNINISIDNSIINNSCNNYIKGIYWTYYYYKKINLDHDWYYPYNYPPTSKDLANYSKVNKIEDIKSNGNFIDNNIQLLLILPKDSIDLIKESHKKYMTDISSGLLHMYPESYKIQTFLKTHLWECCPILPTIDINKMKKIIK